MNLFGHGSIQFFAGSSWRQNLNRLLEALKKMRLTHQNDDTARQIRKGADLA
jgi:hypothetical protein